MYKRQIKGLLDVDKELWLEDVKGVEELYAQIGDHVPAELHAEAACLLYTSRCV